MGLENDYVFLLVSEMSITKYGVRIIVLILRGYFRNFSTSDKIVQITTKLLISIIFNC